MVTTIFEPSEAVRRQASLADWCLVVVGDKKGPGKYEIKDVNQSTFIFLTVKDQDDLNIKFPMITKIPWNHFGRKNIGYLYAILNGAQMIWDFDDDNTLINNMIPIEIRYNTSSGKLIETLSMMTEVLSYPNNSAVVFNPYPIFGAPRKYLYLNII